MGARGLRGFVSSSILRQILLYFPLLGITRKNEDVILLILIIRFHIFPFIEVIFLLLYNGFRHQSLGGRPIRDITNRRRDVFSPI